MSDVRFAYYGGVGVPDRGLRRALKFLAWAKERAQPLPFAFALNCVATVSEWCREGREGLQYSDALLALTAEHGFSHWYSFAQIGRGQAFALLGKANEAITEIKSAFTSYEATGAMVPGWAYSGLAFAYLAAERPEEGLGVAAKGLELADKAGDREALSELHRLRGELILMNDSSATAETEASFRAPIAAARQQSARFPELRATVGLARLLAKQGKRNEARAMLADIYGWFTEGFDTADLKDAKALLDELSG